MPGLTSQEVMIIVNRWIGVNAGYLGDFSYRTHAEFYPEYCNLEYDPYELDGTTRERFIEILSDAPPHHQAKIVRGILNRFPIDAGDAPPTRSEELRERLIEAAERIESIPAVGVPDLRISSEIVQKALDDAETLIGTAEAGNAIDRVHTALHGYLIALCESAEIEHDENDSITTLFKRLRREHRGLQDSGPRADDVESVLRALATIIDKLQPVRNRASLAHPNPRLLAEPEATLVINAARSIFHYLDMKSRG